VIIKIISIVSIIVSVICFVIILLGIVKHPQPMYIMNIVWPVTALYSGLLGLLMFYTIGKDLQQKKMQHNIHKDQQTIHDHSQKIVWKSVLVGTLHCGAGCMLGDFIAEFILLFFPVTLFGSALFGGWGLDFIFAFILGIVFQYYAIKPMKNISSYNAIIGALKADTLSLIFWQIGMYSWLGICFFKIYHHKLEISDPVFWFMMQISMLFGLVVAYPVNWWLIKKGIKEAM
jgi:hypothetical protein